MKSAEVKRAERAFAADARRAQERNGPLDIAALERDVEAAKARRADREKKSADLQREIADSATGKQPVLIDETVSASLAEITARIQPKTEAEMRVWDLENRIFPRLESWGFEKRFRREIGEWNCAEQEATFTLCKRTLRGVGAVVALIGIRGAGKTTIAAQLAIERAWRELRAQEAGRGWVTTFVYRKMTALVSRFKPLFANFGSVNAEALAEALQWLCNEDDVLVIDEMHDLRELAVREALLIDVIDRRYAAEKDTVLISNQTPADFERETPPSVLSRLHEHGRILRCEWPSWR